MDSGVKRIAVGADHAGFTLKKQMLDFLKEEKYDVVDFGTHSAESVDYPDYAEKVAEAVGKGDVPRGLLICYSGIGMDITANKVKGVRSGLCLIPKLAELSRQHNDTNVLCLASGFTTLETAKEIVKTWLSTPFEGGRHARRVDKIKDYENQ